METREGAINKEKIHKISGGNIRGQTGRDRENKDIDRQRTEKEKKRERQSWRNILIDNLKT